MATFFHLLIKLGLTILLAFLPLFNAIGQVENQPEKVRLKILREKNGKTEVIDTTVTVAAQHDLFDAVKAMKLDSSIVKSIEKIRLHDELHHELEASSSGRREPVIIFSERLQGDTAVFRRLHGAKAQVYGLDSVGSGKSFRILYHNATTVAGDTALHRLLRRAAVRSITADSLRLKGLRLAEVRSFSIPRGADSVPVFGLKGATTLHDTNPEDIERIIVRKQKLEPGDTLLLGRNHERITFRVDSETGDSKIIKIDEQGKEHELNAGVFELKSGETTTFIMLKTKVKEVSPEDREALKAAGAPIETSLEEELRVEEISFYPNPTNGRFTLTFKPENRGNTTIRVMDSTGRQVYTEQLKNQKGGYSREIDLTKYGSGIYFLQIAQGKRTYTKKIVVQ